MGKVDVFVRILQVVQNLEVPSIGHLVPLENDVNSHIVEILVLVGVHIYGDFNFLGRFTIHNALGHHFISTVDGNIIAHSQFAVFWNGHPVLL